LRQRFSVPYLHNLGQLVGPHCRLPAPLDFRPTILLPLRVRTGLSVRGERFPADGPVVKSALGLKKHPEDQRSMTIRKQSGADHGAVRASHSIDPASAQAFPPGPPQQLLLSRDQLERWAEMIASEDAPLPQGLSPEQEQLLVERVRMLRRAALIGHVARLIASDLHAQLHRFERAIPKERQQP
jgi:hypothetical protein